MKKQVNDQYLVPINNQTEHVNKHSTTRNPVRWLKLECLKLQRSNHFNPIKYVTISRMQPDMHILQLWNFVLTSKLHSPIIISSFSSWERGLMSQAYGASTTYFMPA